TSHASRVGCHLNVLPGHRRCAMAFLVPECYTVCSANIVTTSRFHPLLENKHK
ncbi:hypothetical protein L9F63_007429, partial [Diploptera punctata]